MIVEQFFIVTFYILISFNELGVKRNMKTSFQKATLERVQLYL